MTVPKMAVLAVLLVLATAGLASPGAHVTVLKCCPYGETLDPHTQDGQPACMRVDNDAAASWAPRIYSRRQKTYLTAVPAHWTVHAASRPTCGERARMVVAHPNDQPVFLLIEDGRLYLHERSDQPLAPGRFCVDSTAVLVCLDKDDDSPVAAAATTAASANAIAEGAPVKNKLHKPRLRKCCIGEAVFSEEERGCVPRVSVPHLWTAAGGHLREDFTVVESFPKCAKETYGVRGLLPSMAKTVTSTAAPAPPAARVEQDGSVWLSSGTVLRPEDFCLENMVEIGAVAVLGCLGESPVGEPDLRFTLYPALLFLSVFFLAATLLASCLLPAAYHQLHWRCQTNYVASLMLGDLFLAVTQVAGAALKGPFCVVFAVLMHFLFLAAFFWLNTMCFNIWWTFRLPRPDEGLRRPAVFFPVCVTDLCLPLQDLRPASVDKNQEAVRMRLYEVYAWGGPLVIAGVAAALDHLPADQYPHLLRPGFGLETCWFLGDMEILPYFFGPVAVLLFINLCLFIATARELTCGLWKADGAKPTTERATLRRVCLKLVVVMGVTWSVDVVSWAVGGPHSVWYVTDVVNLLQGVFIFIVVGCQPHVWSAVKRLWCLRESRSEASRRALHLSSTSQGPHSLGPDSFTITTTTTTTTTNGTPAKLQLQSNGNGSAPAPPAVGGDLAANSETPC